MIELDDKIDARWGDPANKWSGKQVREWIQEKFKLIIEAVNNLEISVPKVFYIKCIGNLDTFLANQMVTGLYNRNELKELLDSNDYANYTFKLVFGLTSPDAEINTADLATNMLTVSNIQYVGNVANAYMLFSAIAANTNQTGFCEIGGRVNFYDNTIGKIWQKARSVTDFITFPSNGNTYGVRNNQPEIITNSGEAVVVYTLPTATSVAKDSLKQGVLVVPFNSTPEMMEEVKELLGEELFNELAAASVQTQELKPQLSVEEEIELAKAQYYERKAHMATLAEASELNLESKKVKEE